MCAGANCKCQEWNESNTFLISMFFLPLPGSVLCFFTTECPSFSRSEPVGQSASPLLAPQNGEFIGASSVYDDQPVKQNVRRSENRAGDPGGSPVLIRSVCLSLGM